jgi:biotin carboxyl carrier protein
MKTFQQIPAGLDGKNITFLVDNEEPVMAGQIIAEVDP